MPTASPDIRITVVIICFKQAQYIVEAIDSVLAQTEQGPIHEIIVVDDCSPDNSVAVAEEAARKDPRIRVLRRDTNSGACAAPRNDAIRAGTGTHFAFLDGDDVWMPEKIATQAAALRAHPEVGLLFSDYIVFDDDSDAEERNVVRHYEAGTPHQLRDFFVHGGPIIPSCAIVSRAAVDAVGVFDPEMRFNEDSEYWMRIASEFPIHHQPVALIRKREWFGSLGSAKYGLENLECKREITRRMLARVPELAEVAPRREAQIELKTAVHHFTVGDRVAARTHLRAALTLDPGLRKAQLYLGLSYLSRDPETLIDVLRRARTRLPAALRG
jgi:glycosyltransferase involved in cell wall biosynthesis